MIRQFIDSDVKPILEVPAHIQDKRWMYLPLLNQTGELENIIELSIDGRTIIHLPTLLSELIITSNTHPIECANRMYQASSNILFLVEYQQYIGAITNSTLFDYFQENFQFENENCILEIEVPSHIHSLEYLVRMIESEGNKIRSYSEKFNDFGKLRLTLCLSNNDLRNILGILENKGYDIIQLYNEQGLQSHLKWRYENLLNYLNV